MKKKLMASIALSCVLMMGCANEEDKMANLQMELDSFQQEYIEKNGVDVFSGAVDDLEDVIVFENEDDYGVGSFYYDDALEEIKFEISTMAKDESSSEIRYAQIKGKEDYYIGIFLDESLMADADSTCVTFFGGKIDEPYAIQQTVNGNRGQILSYESDELRMIDKIEVLNKDNQVIHEVY
jgi:hypothetical protein